MKKILLILISIVLVSVLAWLFVQSSPPVDNAAAKDPGPISVISPIAGSTVGKKFTVEGTANTLWFFEATMPAKVESADHTILWEGAAVAQSDWTAGMVSFVADIDVESYRGPATITLYRDNPSEDASLDKTFSMDIVVK